MTYTCLSLYYRMEGDVAVMEAADEGFDYSLHPFHSRPTEVKSVSGVIGQVDQPKINQGIVGGPKVDAVCALAPNSEDPVYTLNHFIPALLVVDVTVSVTGTWENTANND